jgi:hypothetical protein
MFGFSLSFYDFRHWLNELYKAISKQENSHPEAVFLVVVDFNAGKLKSVMSHVQPEQKKLETTFTPRKEMYTKLSLAFHLDTNPDAYKKSCYARRRTKHAKCQYKTKTESHYTDSGTRWMW